MSLVYWFSLTPPAIAGGAAQLWGALAVGAFIVSALIRWRALGRLRQGFLRQPWQRLARLLTASGAILLVLLFFRYEGVPFFSARFWLLLLALGDLVWLVVIIRTFTKVPAQKRAWEEEQTRRRYLK